MTDQTTIREKLVQLTALAPSGYALAMHVRFTTPTFLFQTYKRGWLDYYSQNGLVMSDPTVRWAFENRGIKDWAELTEFDDNKVLVAAADYGLRFGVTCSIGTEASPSFGSFAREDRAFTEEEAKALSAIMEEVHRLTDNLKVLSPETAAELTELSIRYTHPNDN